MKMPWPGIWLTACLATATFAQVHIVNRQDVTLPAVSVSALYPHINPDTGPVPVKNENNLINGDVNVGVRDEQAPEGETNEIGGSDEEGPDSSDVPSNEVPRPSNEVPGPSNEVPGPSNEVPGPSNEVPGLSNEVPNPSNEIINPSNEVPSPSIEKPDSSIESNSIENISVESQESVGSSDSGSSSGSVDRTVESLSAESIETGDLPPIETTLGPVKGTRWRETDITAYIDIPYGKIETPFEAPQTATQWNEIHDVSEHDKRCPQYIEEGFVGNLDCLTLSLFVPAGAETASVLFYIHDSNFHSGDPMIYGPEHLVPKGVILVLPNYRINALGFLCLQNETASGNAGLKDLSKALEYVVENIERFGGNPDNIVVGGDGNAGALAGYMALSPSSKKHIKKVIAESGSMLSHIALDRQPENTAWTLAENIRNDDRDIPLNNPFSEASLESIVKAAKGMTFYPCIEHNEKPFISDSPWTLLNGETDITFMIGSASRAGTHEAAAISGSFVDDLNQDYGLILPNDLLFNTKAERDLNALKVKTQYFGTDPISRDQLKEIALWFTDATYMGPTLRSARCLMDAGATVYLYEFDFVGDLNRELISLNWPEVGGAVRSDIIGYLFTQDGVLPTEDSTEKQLIDQMVELWVSFIDTGVPKATGIEEWKKLEAGAQTEEEFLHITAEPEPVKGVHVSRLQVWTQLYQQFYIERNAAPSTPANYAFVTIIFWLTTKLDYQ